MKLFVKAIHKLADYTEWLSIAAIVAMMALVVVNCVSRRVGAAIAGTVDYVGFMSVLIIAPAIARCAKEQGHVSLPMLTDKLPRVAQHIIVLIISVVCFAFCGVMAWSLYNRALRTLDRGLTGMTTSIPVYPFIFLEAFAILLLCLVYVTDIVLTVEKLATKELTAKELRGGES